MHIDPIYTNVGSLFNHNPMFYIPKYQRAYAWKTGEGEPINDFSKDLEEAFHNRKKGKKLNHFFGGILSVKHAVRNVVNQHEYEIIDGQQRIATFNLLAACLIKQYEEISTKNSGLIKIIKKRVETLEKSFIEFEQEVNRSFINVNVLKLSLADSDFFRKLVKSGNISERPNRDSHHNLLNAYKHLKETISELVSGNCEEQIDNLEIIENIIKEDFTILHMVTENKEDAYRLFQVLNDRGASLTDGDLLRAKTLELVEDFKEIQKNIVLIWNEVLRDKPSKTENYLRWIYESKTGKAPGKINLFDKFIDIFLLKNKAETRNHALNIEKTIEEIHNSVKKCRKLEEGEWLYEEKQPINAWDRNRLKLLLVELKHTTSIPLLLAASNLDHKKFSEIIQIVERVFFRYKLICNQHAGKLKKIYSTESLKIKNSSNQYQIASLRESLNKLIESEANDAKFKNSLFELEYTNSSQKNKILKYLLLTVEYYYSWLTNEDKSLSPKCLDKSRLYDFYGTSIEHIYPVNIPNDKEDKTIEPIKHTLGNLTIMDPSQNTLASNKVFCEKLSIYKSSSIDITKKIGTKKHWRKEEIERHQKELIDAAILIFVP